MRKIVTICTPTYNRAYIIHNLYLSLCKQTCHDFEWLVIDDGSEDQTRDKIEQYSRNTSFPVRYYYQPNGGKCRAVNRGIDLAEGFLFIVVDSDDVLVENAIEKILTWEKELKNACESVFCGLSGNMGTSVDHTPNRLSGKPYVDATLLDRYNFFDGEREFVFYTSIIRKYIFPVYDGEKFMTEAVMYNRLAHDGYIIRFYDDIICVYEYQSDGLTRKGKELFLQNPRGYGLWIKEKVVFEKRSLLYRLKTYYTFVCDLCDCYDLRTISECLSVPYTISAACYCLHKVRLAFKRDKG